jgi:lysophospholipase L1-like esterase
MPLSIIVMSDIMRKFTIYITIVILASLTSLLVQSQDLSISSEAHHEVTLSVQAAPEMGYRIERSVNWEDWEGVSDHWAETRLLTLPVEPGEQAFFRLNIWELPYDPIKIALIGDSTIVDFSFFDGTFGGWGEALHTYFGLDVRVANIAIAGQSTKTYLESQWQINNLKNVRPEFVLLQFGMIDEHSAEPEKLTTMEEYEANLEELVHLIRGFDGSPVLVSPVTKRAFGADGKVVPWLDERTETMRKLAERLQCHFIDLNQMSKELFNELGDANSAHLTTDDHLHFYAEGADLLSGLVASKMPAFLKPYLNPDKVSAQ